MSYRFSLTAFLFIFLLFPAGASASREITVSAAASLTDALEEIGAAFKKDTGIEVVFNYGASRTLLEQIKAGAPADVFASADETTMDQAEKDGLILKADRKDFAGNDLVLAAPIGSNKISGVKDLKNVARIAIANPKTAPAGLYAKQALMQMKLWDVLLPKFIYGVNVRQALEYIGSGEVDAGFVYMTDVFSARDRVKAVAILSEGVSYPAAVVSSSKDQDAARKFIDFLSGKKDRAILKKYGFKAPR